MTYADMKGHPNDRCKQRKCPKCALHSGHVQTSLLRGRALLAASEETQQEHEHIDEVQIQVQRAHDGGFGEPFAIHGMSVRNVIRLDLLCVIGGEACKDQHADRRDRKHDRRGLQEDVDDHRDDQPNQTHHQERAHSGQVFLGGVAIDRQARECDRGNKEDLHNRRACIDQEDRAKRKPHHGSK